MQDIAGFYGEFGAEADLLRRVRLFLLSKADTIPVDESALSFSFDSEISQVYITLFQEGTKLLRWGSRRDTLQHTLEHASRRLRQHLRFSWFNVADPDDCRIMFEIVTKAYPCNVRNMTILRFSPNRFEAGVTGLKCVYEGQTRYFMPTDAVTHSVMSNRQVLNYLSKRFGISRQTDRISERVYLMRRLPIEYTFIESRAFISYGDATLPLFRGYPMPVHFSKQRLEATMYASMEWLVENMESGGKFLYYYDPVKDSEVDFQHPNMKDPTYYNILRHSGGTVTLLLGYELSGQESYLEAARRSIDFFNTTLQEHTVDGQYACYPFYNRKAKLGGAGIGLVALMHYYRLTGDGRYRRYMDGLVRHILSRVDESGEMIGYYLHPRFNDGAPLIAPDDEEKKGLFSFYYPGEALLGLAMYYRYCRDIPPEFQGTIVEKSRRALDFLVHGRPEKYAELFEPLPSDGWLMQAIESWDETEGVVDDTHREFVYGDATKMMTHMYLPDNAPQFDYVGGFYYQYGDHVYHDASRCEGLIAAYRLAKKHGLERFAGRIFNRMLLSAKGLQYTYNSAESTYAHRFPKRSVGSFRFKLTRQWVRVDSVQHTACFYAGLSRLL